MKRRKKLWGKIASHWKPVAVSLLLTSSMIGLFGWNLSHHTQGFTPEEITFIQSADSAGNIVESPAFLPHRAAFYGLLKAGASHVVIFRLVSVLVGVIAVYSLYCILKRWYTRRVAVLSSILFASSTLVLYAVRSATPDVNYLLFLPLLAIGLWLQVTKQRKAALFILLTVLSLTVYIPGFIWFAIVVMIWHGKRLARVIGRASLGTKALCFALVGVLLLPAIISLAMHPRELLSVAGLPTELQTLSQYVIHAKDSVLAIFWQHGAASPSQWLLGTPILDIITIALVVLGIYSLRFESKLRRSQVQLGALLGFSVLVLFHGLVPLSSLLPPLYLLAGGGIAFMLQQWFAVFPRNPFARSLALALITVAVIGAAYYHTYRYYQAWPNHPDTKQALTGQYLIK